MFATEANTARMNPSEFFAVGVQVVQAIRPLALDLFAVLVEPSPATLRNQPTVVSLS